MRRTGWIAGLMAVVDGALLVGVTEFARRAWVADRDLHGADVTLGSLLGFNPWMPPALVVIGGWLLTLRMLGYYDSVRTPTAIRSAGVLSHSLIYVLGLIMAAEFFQPNEYFSRSLLLWFVAAGFVSLGGLRWVVMRFGRMIPLPVIQDQVLVVGVGEEARLIQEQLQREDSVAYRVAGYARIGGANGEEMRVEAAQILGQVGDLRELVNEFGITTIVLATRHLPREEALKLASQADQLGLRILQVPFTWGVVSPRIGMGQLGELKLIDLTEMAYPTLGAAFKRGFDLVAVVLLALLLAPVMFFAGLGILLEGGSPVFYTSPRVGRGGRIFRFYKFRSMVVGAREAKKELAGQNEADGVLFKIRNDPRVTRIGGWLRRLSIDELPQLWNVVKGDMNLVGPRPLPAEDLVGIESDPEMVYWFDLRHHVQPGITGLWQVSGRSELGIKEMVRLDLYYVQNWSPWLDLKILLLTVPAVLKGRGAT